MVRIYHIVSPYSTKGRMLQAHSLPYFMDWLCSLGGFTLQQVVGLDCIYVAAIRSC